MNAVLIALMLLVANSAFGQAAPPRAKVNPATAAKEAAKVAGQTGTGTPDQRKLIEFYERELLESDKKGNWDAIARRLAPDFLEIAGNGQYFTKEQVAKLFPQSRVTDYKISDIQFRSLGADAALLAYHLDVHATFAGKPLPAAFLVSTVWRKQAGAWVVIFHQGTPIPEEGTSQR